MSVFSNPASGAERDAASHVEAVLACRAGRKRSSVAHMMRPCAGHDLVHRRQMERIRRAIQG
jgi:hypothetical protein